MITKEWKKKFESKDKEVLIKHALLLAKYNSGKTAPNPWVGAVLVKGGRIIGKGFHKGAGFPHAEIEAIHDAMENGFSPSGAELFVSLQPCNTFGRTPPCTMQLKNYGISKVYFSLHDPSLDQSSYHVGNLSVKGGILEEEGQRILLPYIIYVKERRPYVIVKLAMTLDGKIADFEGNSKYLTSQKSLQVVHILRSRSNFILVGKDTVEKDNPYLDTRNLPAQYIRKFRKVKKQISGDYPNPVKIVLGLPSYPYPDSPNILNGNNVVFFVEEKDRELIVSDFTKSGSILGKENVSFLFQKEKGIELVLDFVFKMGGIVLLVEGGIRVAWNFLKSKAVDELWLFFTPKIFGGGKGFDFPDAFTLGKELKLKIIEAKRISDDLLVRCSLRGDGKFWDLF